jgi:hypothetical protein
MSYVFYAFMVLLLVPIVWCVGVTFSLRASTGKKTISSIVFLVLSAVSATGSLFEGELKEIAFTVVFSAMYVGSMISLAMSRLLISLRELGSSSSSSRDE